MNLKIDYKTRGASPVGPLDACKNGWLSIFRYSGCASRSEFWYFFLIQYIFVTFALLVLGETMPIMNTEILLVVYGIPLTISLVSLTVRRLHDLGRTGWWLVLFAFFNSGFVQTGVASPVIIMGCVLLWWLVSPGIESKINPHSENYIELEATDQESRTWKE